MRAIAFDVGAQDAGIAAGIKVLGRILTDHQVKHVFEIYEGNHTNHVVDRVGMKMVPFFATNLAPK